MANEKFQNAIKGVAQKVPPVWFMRQAGRYHQHYQNLKSKHTFMELCKSPELATEVAMGPIQDFDFDVAILFSDLLFPLEALGMGLKYDPGPIMDRELRPQDLAGLRPIDEALEHLKFQKTAVELTRRALPKDKSLIGFVGGPWTLFTYATAGQHDGNLIGAKTRMDFFNSFCEIMVPLLEKNIQLQLDGGAEVVMFFDTAAGELSPMLFNQYLAPHLTRLAQKFPKRVGYYSKGTQSAHLDAQLLKDPNWAGLGFDHRWDMTRVLKTPTTGFKQGNFDQALLFSEPSVFRTRLAEYLKPIQELSPEERKGWVCGLGHGVLPKTPEANVREFVQIIRKTFGQ